MPKSIYTADHETFLSLLRETRIAAGMNQGELAGRLGRPQSFVSKFEGGERRLDVLELRQICQALGVTFPGFARKLENELSRGRSASSSSAT